MKLSVILKPPHPKFQMPRPGQRFEFKCPTPETCFTGKCSGVAAGGGGGRADAWICLNCIIDNPEDMSLSEDMSSGLSMIAYRVFLQNKIYGSTYLL